MKNNFPSTEKKLNIKKTIDKLPLKKAIELMNNDQKLVHKVLKSNLTDIEQIIEKIYNILSKSSYGRIIYTGAGTSGRIGVQDGVELYPTFGWPRKRIDFLIAGGEKSILNAIEGAEDDINSAKTMSNSLKLNSSDVLIGLAASGNTPYTNQVLKEGMKKKCLVIAISNNPKGEILNNCNMKIILDTGPEVITGSTRLKAGTAQKICLNIISSMVMTKLGRVKNGNMIYLKPTNAKLKKRKELMKFLLD